MITDEQMGIIVMFMNDDIREEVYNKFAPCSNEKFFEEYSKRDRGIIDFLLSEFCQWLMFHVKHWKGVCFEKYK